MIRASEIRKQPHYVIVHLYAEQKINNTYFRNLATEV